jgi:hypothetical protein
MRTSGAATESRMIIAVVLIALTLLIAFAGGPREFLLTLQDAVQAVGAFLFTTYQNFRV